MHTLICGLYVDVKCVEGSLTHSLCACSYRAWLLVDIRHAYIVIHSHHTNMPDLCGMTP